MFGPEYQKINSLWKRDVKGKILIDQYSQPEFEYLADVPWRWTEKIDGTNIRLHWDGRMVTIGGRTDAAQVPAKLILALQKYTEPTDLWAKAFPGCNEGCDITLYGEGYGAGIQKGGGNYLPDRQDFILFDVRVGQWWLKDENVTEIAETLGIEQVPVLSEYWTPYGVWEMILDYGQDEDWLGQLTSRWEGVTTEGVVGRPLVDLYDRQGKRIITKLKLKDTQDL